MMQKLIEESNHLYEDLKGVLYRINHLQDSFDNNFYSPSELEGSIKSIINDNLKTILADCYLTMETLSNISSANNEDELRELIDQLRIESVTSG